MNYVEKSRLLKTIILVFSLAITILPCIVIFSELDSGFSMVICTVIVGILVVFISSLIERTINGFISGEVEGKRYTHLGDFFDFVEGDKGNRKTLTEPIPIYDENGDEVGTQTVYGFMSAKKYDYSKTL
jgi:hypothetical protein